MIEMHKVPLFAFALSAIKQNYKTLKGTRQTRVCTSWDKGNGLAVVRRG